MRVKIAISVIVLDCFIFSGFLFGYNVSKDLGCDNQKQWSRSPDIEEYGYVHSSLVPFREWLVNYFSKKTSRPTLTVRQCLAISSFLRVYAWSGEPCNMRSLPEIYKWMDDCSVKWSDADYTGYDGCYIYDVPIMTDQNAAFVITRYLINNPECRINTPEELRSKINKKVIQEAKELLAKSSEISSSTVPDCEQIRNPSFWTKFVKWPKNPFKIWYVRILAFEASNKARELFPVHKKGNKECSSLHNGRGDAFRHCYWTCLITEKYGTRIANDYSDFHEFDSRNPCEEAIMDYKNNRTGVSYGASGQDCFKSCLNSTELEIIQEEKCL